MWKVLKKPRRTRKKNWDSNIKTQKRRKNEHYECVRFPPFYFIGGNYDYKRLYRSR